jgi:hypothetical protein
LYGDLPVSRLEEFGWKAVDLGHIAAPLHDLDRDGTTPRLCREMFQRWPIVRACYYELFSTEGGVMTEAATGPNASGSIQPLPDLHINATQDNSKPSQSSTAGLVVYLFSWRDILDALEMKNDDESQRRVRDLNKKFDGPINLPKKGGQPKVNKEKLLAWWNRLEELWETKEGGRNAEATTESRHNYGRTGEVIPDIGGHVKKRRQTKPGG